MNNKFTKKKLVILTIVLALVAFGFASPILADELETNEAPQQSRTGPIPPPKVLARDAYKLKIETLYMDTFSQTTLPVPAYLWRHGCGPTAVGMVVGYYDTIGCSDLIPGSAVSQTSAVDQAIASGGDYLNPYPPGSERHYEDYAQPEDYAPTMLDDDYITQERTPHDDDCIADYMDTSKSTLDNYYGWSWGNAIGPSFVNYVNQQNATYEPSFKEYHMSGGTFPWTVLTDEIDAGRPMVFLVDTDGDYETDHFVAVIGYRTSPSNQYGCWDTWSHTIRWENFVARANGVPWGIWGGWQLKLAAAPTLTKIDGVNDGDCVETGDEITYTINYPAGDINDVNIIDYLPNEVNYISSDPCGFYDPCSRTVTWNIGSLNPSESCTVTLTVDVNYSQPGSTIRNECEIKSNNQTFSRAYEDTPVCCWRGTVIYVDANAPDCNSRYKGASWQCPYTNLQDAMEDASISSCCEEIWVAARTYKPDKGAGVEPNDRGATFQLINNVAIYGGFPPGGGQWQDRNPDTYKTILSGDINTPDVNTDNSYHVATGSNTNKTAVLDGFIITEGKANDAGGGMFNSLGSPTIIDCTFSGNYGGGIYNSSYGSPTVANCTFSENSATDGGGMNNNSFSNPTVTNCTFTGNSATNNGGGMCNNSFSSPIVTNCILWGNTAPNGPQIYKDASSSPVVSYCDVQGGWSEPGWNPDTDSSLKFNLNMETHTATTTTDAVGGWVGTLTNSAGGANIWEMSGRQKIGTTSADFNYPKDILPYGAPNDCRLSVVKAGGSDVLNFGDATVKRTWTFWFNTPDITQSTFLRHQHKGDATIFWDMYIKNGKLCFRNNKAGAQHTFETVDDVNSLGIAPKTWHHVAFVIDRTTKFTSKIYLDGLAVDVNYGVFPSGTASGNVNNVANTSPLSVGANGTTALPWSREGEFDGMLDDIRVYQRPLAPSEVSILYQYPHLVPSGTGNINADPCFVGGGNLRLKAGSPCIDAGDNNSVPPDYADLDGDDDTAEPTPFDLDGFERFIDGDCNSSIIVDMGAYEFSYAYIGDFDNQCDVDFQDFAIFALAWLTEEGQANYKPICDISLPADQRIDMLDLEIFCENWLAGTSP